MEKRNHIKNVLEEIFRSRGYEPGLMVLNAYKPGLCWLMEVILPELKSGPSIDRLDIFYKPFAGFQVLSTCIHVAYDRSNILKFWCRRNKASLFLF